MDVMGMLVRFRLHLNIIGIMTRAHASKQLLRLENLNVQNRGKCKLQPQSWSHL